MEFATLIVVLALLQYIILTAMVGAQRGKHHVKAPAVSGNEAFERAFRVQQNTLENLIVFIPCCFTFALFVSEVYVMIPGITFLVGRTMYARTYARDPSDRGPGFALTILANIVMVLGTLIGVTVRLIGQL